MRLLACAFVFTTALTIVAAQTPTPSPLQAGRQALTEQLDTLAAQQTAARRATIAKIHTKQEAIARQRAVRARLIDLLGGPWPEHTALNARITGASDFEGIHIERLLFQSQPNFYVTALIYTPRHDPNTKLPAILMAPGHSPAGKTGDVPTALAFAHAGFLVLSYDPIGQGERLQYPNPADPTHTLLKGPTGEHGEAGLQPTLIGDAVSRYFLIDAIRATDYLLTRPEVDPHRIGAFGCSGGGLMTALTAALDPRIAAAGVACFTTSFDALLPTLGPQDSEQSIPNFLSTEPAPSDAFSKGTGFSPSIDSSNKTGALAPEGISLDFPDWSELFAPRPYAIIATTEDMFPFAGAQSTEHESRAFYTLFNASDNLAFITGPGHHGHLLPILPRILNFFVTSLHATPDPKGFALISKAKDPIIDDPKPTRPVTLPTESTTVTWTGQVSTAFPYAETVYTLNLKRAAEKLPPHHAQTLAQLQQDVRTVTHAAASPGHAQTYKSGPSNVMFHKRSDGVTVFSSSATSVEIMTSSQPAPGKHAATLLLGEPATESTRFDQLLDAGVIASVFTPRPSPPGTEETKSPLLGIFYLTELRAELTGNTLMGLRIDDTIHAIDYLASRPDINPNNITAEASGHLALVLLHAAILDPRLKHITLHALPPSYTDLLHTSIPMDAPQDILPGVLLHYDTPDLIRALGSRVTVTP